MTTERIIANHPHPHIGLSTVALTLSSLPRLRRRDNQQMNEITIEKQDGPRHGRYVARVTGIDAEAELTYTHRGAELISADHTGAPDVLRGTGAAAALVDFLISDARRSGFRIIPLCPFVRARYEKHPDWQDVMTVAPGEMPRLVGGLQP